MTDRTRWNELLFDNAHRYRLHQDNLRWSLSGGYAAFFFGSILLLTNPNVRSDAFLVNHLELWLSVAGSIYFIALGVENWWYNVFTYYARVCDEGMSRGVDLPSIGQLDWSGARMRFQSFLLILFLVTCGNAFYLFRFLSPTYVDARMGMLLVAVYIVVIWVILLIIIMILRARGRRRAAVENAPTA
jgi:hypothetical protein